MKAIDIKEIEAMTGAKVVAATKETSSFNSDFVLLDDNGVIRQAFTVRGINGKMCVDVFAAEYDTIAAALAYLNMTDEELAQNIEYINPDNTPTTMNANNIHVNNIVATLTDRNNIRKEIELPVIAAIREQAAKFNGKVFNRRFTAAVTKALQDNPNRINVNFRTKWNGETEYDIINVHYNHNGNYGEFSIYPDRSNVHDYTDEDGRLVAERLAATCDRYEAATLGNIADDENAIKRAPEFVARVEALQAEVEAINKDFPLSLRARFTGNIDFRR